MSKHYAAFNNTKPDFSVHLASRMTAPFVRKFSILFVLSPSISLNSGCQYRISYILKASAKAKAVLGCIYFKVPLPHPSINAFQGVPLGC
jgi:hypothetical protein